MAAIIEKTNEPPVRRRRAVTSSDASVDTKPKRTRKADAAPNAEETVKAPRAVKEQPVKEPRRLDHWSNRTRPSATEGHKSGTETFGAVRRAHIREFFDGKDWEFVAEGYTPGGCSVEPAKSAARWVDIRNTATGEVFKVSRNDAETLPGVVLPVKPQKAGKADVSAEVLAAFDRP